MKKNLAIFIFPALLVVFAGSPAYSQAGPTDRPYTQDAPPRPRMERRSARPSPNHQWIGGYYERQNNQWAWTAGRWEQPSKKGAHWIKPQYHHEAGGYRYEEGRWGN